MTPPLSARGLFEALGKRLGLEWVAGIADEARAPTAPASAPNRLPVGLAQERHAIRILGPEELAVGGTPPRTPSAAPLRRLFSARPLAVIVAGDAGWARSLGAAAREAGAACFCSSTPRDMIVDHVEYWLAHRHESLVVHGVLMDVLGIGVMVSGDSGAGKSELALELIGRGHGLVADDAVRLTRVAPDTLNGTCPATGAGFLEVRGLGVIDVRALFGPAALRASEYLELILRLESTAPRAPSAVDRLQGRRDRRTLLGVEVCRITVPVTPGRNVALLSEVAVRDHLLRKRGYDAPGEFARRQRAHLQAVEP